MMDMTDPLLAAKVKFCDMTTPAADWLTATAEILLAQHDAQPDGISIELDLAPDLPPCKLRLMLDYPAAHADPDPV